ncbi:MAG: hypothetical protein H6729_12410 [Deltaproteobacteria bacterium]|nr:hypothetical protein [Deltaproteobacteria bacterium]
MSGFGVTLPGLGSVGNTRYERGLEVRTPIGGVGVGRDNDTDTVGAYTRVGPGAAHVGGHVAAGSDTFDAGVHARTPIGGARAGATFAPSGARVGAGVRTPIGRGGAGVSVTEDRVRVGGGAVVTIPAGEPPLSESGFNDR